MRTILALCMAAAGPLLAADGGAMNDAERAFLVSQMEQSKKAFLASIEGVTAAQWKFKPAPTVWSVAECAEHIILAEDYLFGASQGILKGEAVARPATSSAEQDQKLAAMVGDRSKKATAPEPIVPSGKFNTPEEAAKAFTERRDKSLAYARSTTDELRTHVTKGPLGMMDAYQMLLLMATHTGRHTAQIREVEANADYPKTVATGRVLAIPLATE
ncbi:MAG TPA: DinB family protein [Bryobacteraceae bacterium]|nr:DinB family protein [Bryobacteraceae bacterium]